MSDELTELQDEVITLVAENPEASSSEIAKMAEVQVAPSTVRSVWNEYPGLIRNRRLSEVLEEPEELGVLSFDDDESEELGVPHLDDEFEEPDSTANESVLPEDATNEETFELREEPTVPNTAVDPNRRFGPHHVPDDDEPEDEDDDQSLFERIKSLFR